MLKKIIPFLIPLFSFGELSAQDENVETDQQLWTGATFKLDLGKNWRFEIEEQLRFSNELNGLTLAFTEAGLRYEFTGDFDVKLQYRYQVLTLERNQYRFSLDFSYELDDWDFPVTAELRVRLQDETVTYTGEKDTKARGRIGLNYNMTKLVDPYLQYESFFDFNDDMEFGKNRYTFGLEWKLNGDADLETFYRFEQEINSKNLKYEHVFGLSFSYSMKWKDIF